MAANQPSRRGRGKPDPDDCFYLDQAVAAWNEFKLDHWRQYEPKPTDAKRLWAVALGADWKGSGATKMERLIGLLPKAIEQAARHSAFSSARTTLWTIASSAAGVERLANGILAGTNPEDYDRQILRIKPAEMTLTVVRNCAKRLGISPSSLVDQIIEIWIAREYEPLDPADVQEPLSGLGVAADDGL